MIGNHTQRCAAKVTGTIPRIMRTLGHEMRNRHLIELSMSQFGALMIIQNHDGASVSLVAEHLGLTLSSISKLIDGLVERQFVTRDEAPDDRRRVILKLTQVGKVKLESMDQERMACLAEMLTTLSESECETIINAMDLLNSAFLSFNAVKKESSTNQGEQV